MVKNKNGGFETAQTTSGIASDAAQARRKPGAIPLALAAVLFYNFVGLFDIVSTIAALERETAREANPLMRAIMDNYGPMWIATKLALQFLISGMVLWFPHRIVLMMFLAAASLNAAIVLNNFRIALGY
jgi:hypothetical protein